MVVAVVVVCVCVVVVVVVAAVVVCVCVVGGVGIRRVVLYYIIGLASTMVQAPSLLVTYPGIGCHPCRSA